MSGQPLGAAWLGWFDGAALPNPGRMGIGVVLRGPDGQHFEISRQAPTHGCNNEAEALALCAVMELALTQGVKSLIVSGDSDVATRLVHDIASTEAARLRPIFDVARTLMRQFDHIRVGWVPRYRNHEADRLSRGALGLAAKPAEKPGQRKKRGKR